MPRISIFFIRFALIYFGLSITIGTAMLFHKSFYLHDTIWLWMPVHKELALFGWLIQFVLGVAYWILPRHLDNPVRGNPKQAWLGFLIFNLGIILNLISFAPPNFLHTDGFGRSFQIAGIILIIHLLWSRVVKPQRGHHD